MGPQLALGQAKHSSCMLWSRKACTGQQTMAAARGVALHSLHWLPTGGSCMAGHNGSLGCQRGVLHLVSWKSMALGSWMSWVDSSSERGQELGRYRTQ